MAVGFDEIQEDFRRQFAVTRSPCRQETAAGTFRELGRIPWFTEQILRISELGFELLAHFGADIVTARVNSGADGRFNILGQCAEAAAHFSNSLFDNALDRTAPTRMKDSHSPLLGVDQNNRQAIGSLDANEERQARG